MKKKKKHLKLKDRSSVKKKKKNRKPLCRQFRRVPREKARTLTPASFVLPFEINFVLLWPQCPEVQTLEFPGQVRPAPGRLHTGKKTAARPPYSGRVRIL